jgi:eukaryotic-like serine/threonine-protein kinase
MSTFAKLFGGMLRTPEPVMSMHGSTIRLPGGTSVRVKADHPGAAYKKGDIIGTAYQVLGVLGLGGFSVVYLVYSRDTREVYALKTLRDEFLEDEETRAQFHTEAKVWVNLDRHPYVVRAHFIEELAGRLYIGMEYIEPDEDGINSLEGYLARRPPDAAQSLRWAIQFSHGMEHAHGRGIRCHRDVKPANILIDRSMSVKITDFGFADVIDHTRARTATDPLNRIRKGTVNFSGFGTPMYMPPEQFQNAERCDQRSDIYSFGVVFYQMLSRGRLPYQTHAKIQNTRTDPSTLWHEMHRLHAEARVVTLSSPSFPVIVRCLQKDPAARYQSFGELRADLESLLKRTTGEIMKPGKSRHLEAWELYNKAYSLSSLGQIDEAIDCYDKVVGIEPDNVDAWNNRGVCLRKQGKFEQALDSYSRALDVEKNNVSALSNRGNCLYSMNRLHDALADLTRATGLDAKNESAGLNRAMVEEKLGQPRDAAQSYTRFLALKPRQYAAHVPFAKKRLAHLSRA